jgi:hypothetical protein
VLIFLKVKKGKIDFGMSNYKFIIELVGNLSFSSKTACSSMRPPGPFEGRTMETEGRLFRAQTAQS